MNGTTSQILSLITHGNYFLKCGRIANYYPENATFRFCNTTNFLHLASNPDGTAEESVVAIDPIAWFTLLASEGCKILRAYYHPSKRNSNDVPDHQLAGLVGGGGSWLIEAIYSTWSDFWASRWQVTRREEPEQKIWTVSYGRTLHKTEIINYCPELKQTHQRLYQVLTEVHAFALKKKLVNWAQIFKGALEILEGLASAQNLFGKQIHEDLFSEEELRLMYAAMSSDVFGGMGSWNDLGFQNPDDQKQYEELSFNLYDSMNRALLSSINSKPLV